MEKEKENFEGNEDLKVAEKNNKREMPEMDEDMVKDRQFNFRFSKRFSERLEAECKKRGISKAEFVRNAVDNEINIQNKLDQILDEVK